MMFWCALYRIIYGSLGGDWKFSLPYFYLWDMQPGAFIWRGIHYKRIQNFCVYSAVLCLPSLVWQITFKQYPHLRGRCQSLQQLFLKQLDLLEFSEANTCNEKSELILLHVFLTCIAVALFSLKYFQSMIVLRSLKGNLEKV